MTLECSGNGSSKGFMDAIYNSKWTGTPLAPLLEQCQPDPKVTEVVFYGKDTKEETLRPGTNRELKIEVPFGRSMTLEDAMQHPLLLAYDRNGTPMEHRNGAPLRLIVPGYYGIANVKWLTRIELRDRRYMGRYMARDYVTVRAEERDGALTHVETSVGRMNLKSIIARVTRRPTQGDKIPYAPMGLHGEMAPRSIEWKFSSMGEMAKGPMGSVGSNQPLLLEVFSGSTWERCLQANIPWFRGLSMPKGAFSPLPRMTKLPSRKRTGRLISSGHAPLSSKPEQPLRQILEPLLAMRISL